MADLPALVCALGVLVIMVFYTINLSKYLDQTFSKQFKNNFGKDMDKAKTPETNNVITPDQEPAVSGSYASSKSKEDNSKGPVESVIPEVPVTTEEHRQDVGRGRAKPVLEMPQCSMEDVISQDAEKTHESDADSGCGMDTSDPKEDL